jgi:hypothetical protein
VAIENEPGTFEMIGFDYTWCKEQPEEPIDKFHCFKKIADLRKNRARILRPPFFLCC